MTEAPRPSVTIPASGKLSALLKDLAHPPTADSNAAQVAPVPGERIGRFVILREIGRGGFGVVLEARDLTLGRRVALKLVRPGKRVDRAGGPGIEEAEAVARLSHSNIVQLHDVGASEAGPYLVFELLQGEPLSRRLERGPLPVTEAARMALDLAKALAHAHAASVVHRDLKPSNVFLCADGQVKVLDFGLALVFGRRRTVEGGTPEWMAPEQRRGAPEDERTDVWALGAILFRALSGREPASSRLEIPDAPDLAALLERMLATDPVRRPRDGEEVVEALTPVVRALEAGPTASVVRLRRRLPRLLPGKPRKTRLVASLALAAIVLATGFAFLLGRAGRTASTPASIAVLPFEDLSPGGDQEYLSDGIAEEILNALTEVEGLRVAGRRSSFSFKGTGADGRAIAEKLGVATVLEGSVRKEGDRVRVTAEMVNARDGFRLWSQTFDRELKGIFEVQDEIARAVVAALKARLAAGQTLSTQRSADPEVYRDFLLGRHFEARATRGDQVRAAEAFERALARDPRYAPAWAGLARAIGNITDAQGATNRAVVEGFDRAMAMAEKAIALDSSLGDGYAVRGELRARARWDWAGARADYERALALKPGDSSIHHGYAINVLVPLGRLDEAARVATRATELDPVSIGGWETLGRVRYIVGDLDASEAAFERSRQIAPERASRYHAFLRLLQRRPADALAVAEQWPVTWARLECEAMARHDLGDEMGSRRALDELVARFPGTAAWNIAMVYAWRGERDLAFEWLDRAYAQHDSGLPWLKVNPLMKSLRDDPRFAAHVRRMNLLQ